MYNSLGFDNNKSDTMLVHGDELPLSSKFHVCASWFFIVCWIQLKLVAAWRSRTKTNTYTWLAVNRQQSAEHWMGPLKCTGESWVAALLFKYGQDMLCNSVHSSQANKPSPPPIVSLSPCHFTHLVDAPYRLQNCLLSHTENGAFGSFYL